MILILACIGCTAIKNRRRKRRAAQLGIPFEPVKFDRSMAKAELKALTLEPMLFLAYLGIGLEFGAQASTAMLMGKVCEAKAEHSARACADFTSNHFDGSAKKFRDDLGLEPASALDEVLREANRVRMFQALLALLPALLFTWLSLGLARNCTNLRAILLFSMALNVLAYALAIVHYAFLAELPLAFFYTETLVSWFGADVLFTVAVAKIAEITDNSRRFRFLQSSGMVAGTIGGPFVQRWLGYYGTFGARAGLYLTGMLLAAFMVKDVKAEADEDEGRPDEKPLDLKKASRLISDGFKALSQETGKRTASLYFHLCVFSLLILCEMQAPSIFLFMFKRFQPFVITDFTSYQAVLQLTALLGFFIVMPFLKGTRLRLSDATVVYFACFVSGFGQLFSGLSKKLWQFELAQVVVLMQPFTKCYVESAVKNVVPSESHEGIAAMLSFVSALLPLFANPMYKMLFDQTISDHASAIVLLTAGILCLATIAAALALALGPREQAMREDKELVREREIEQLKKVIEKARVRAQMAQEVRDARRQSSPHAHAHSDDEMMPNRAPSVA